MHPAESVWQQWRQDPILREVLQKASMGAEDPRVALPGLSVANYIMSRIRLRPDMAAFARSMDQVNMMSRLGNTFQAYRGGKQVYQLTRELTRELAKLQMPLRLPMRELRLPRQGCVLDFTEHLGADHPQAVVFVSYDVYDETATHISAVTFRPGSTAPWQVASIPADLSGRSVWQAHQDTLRAGREHLVQGLQQIRARLDALPELQRVQALLRDDMPLRLQAQWEAEIRNYDKYLGQTPEDWVAENPVLPLVVNTLLYLQGDPDVVKTVHPGMRPVRKPKQAPNLEKLARRLDNAEPTVQRIGERFTAAIKLYEIERAKMKAEHEARGTKCPHLRAPHPHVYRIGEGRLDVVVKFLGWIGVKGAEVPQVLKEAYAPVITPVK